MTTDRWIPKETDRPVYRTRPLPRGELKGLFLLAEPVFVATRDALVSFALAGIANRGHEGIVYWAGREAGDCTVFMQAVVPIADHSHGRVMVSAEEIGRTQRAARRDKCGILCQVHSHPGADTRHSDGDDELVLLPFEGMLSVVAPQFGVALRSIEELSIHQFQDGKWVLCSSDSVSSRLLVVPALRDLR
jgi:proteasome lid subunit RPN8/RPN11